MNNYVLDSSAFLAHLWQEPGWQTVEKLMLEQRVTRSVVNVSEVIAKALDRGLPIENAEVLLTSLEVEQIDFNGMLALQTALLRPLTRHRGLSLGDRACLALAKSMNAVALTADKPWLDLELGIRVECIR